MTKAHQPYTPNIQDPRVRDRIKKAYGFARGVLSEHKPHGWSTRYIDRYFGQQQHPLSQWLRSQLLICTDDKYSKNEGLTKQYKLSVPGANYIRTVLKGSTGTSPVLNQEPAGELAILIDDELQFDRHCVDQWIRKEFAAELATGEFVYKDQSNRLWHPLQSIRREYKKPALAGHGFHYHYDIQCAAPTLIHQHAQQQLDSMDLYLSALRRYLHDRNQVRNELAQALDIDSRTAKILINALFCGARIGTNRQFALSQLLNHDPARIEYIKQDPYITQLRADIKTCWDHIAPSMSRRSIQDKNNRERLLPINSREKWARYFELERSVLNAVVDHMRARSIGYFLEHDGWACNQVLDSDVLSQEVLVRTGYQVQFELARHYTQPQRNILMAQLLDLFEESTGVDSTLRNSSNSLCFSADALTQQAHWTQQADGSYRLNELGCAHLQQIR